MSRMRYLVFIGHVCALLILSFFLPASGHASIGIAGALDNPVQTDGVTPLAFTPDGAAPWSAVTATLYNGGSGTVAQSGAIGGGAYSSITTTVTGPASLSFYQKVSSQLTYDKLTFSLDGSVKSTISGSVNWQQKLFTLPTGTHTLVWKYAKNLTINGGSDAAWLDKVVVSPNTALKVTYPNGGENLIAGAPVNITWNAPAAAEKYDLYFTTNNGTTWTSIASNYTGPGFMGITYPWTWPVPKSNMTACKVKVVAKNNAGVVVGTDMSDKVFAVNNVRLTSPNGSNVLAAGGSFDITWDSTATATSFNLYYTLNNGTTWTSLATNATGTDHMWSPLPVPPAGNMTACKVKIVAYNGSSMIGTDISDAPFTMQVLKVTAPNGGELMSAKTGTYTIGFLVSGLTNTSASATVSYTINGGSSWPVIGIISGGSAITPGTYTWDWQVPAVTAVKNAKVKVVIKSKSGVVLATDTSDANFTILPVFTISGTVSGATVTSVTMTLGGDDSNTTTTDSLGKYSFKTLLKGNYTISAAKAGYYFNPASTALAVTTANITTANFKATASSDPVYTLSGTVSGATVTGVTVTLAGIVGGSVQTAVDGTYSFGKLPLGNYSVTPGKTGYTFGPLSRGVILSAADVTGVDFLASQSAGATYSISGKATLNSAALPGVLISVAGDPAAAGITDAVGNYLIKGLKSGGTYTITPSKFGCAFSPANATKTITGANIASLNFIATATHTARGTVASGAPISGATVTVTDIHGISQTAVTAGNGAYGIETTGLTPPFLLLATTGTGSTFYSVSADAAAATTVNITPLTDLIIRSWYGAQGDSMDTAFANPVTYPAPPPTAVAVLGTAVQNMMQLWLNQAGVTASNFNLISTPFSAGGTGVDAVLDQVSIDPGTGAVLVSDGTTTQNSTLIVSTLDSSVTVSTTTTNTNGTSSSSNATVVPTLPAEQTALDSITALMGNFAHTVTIKGASLSGSDLLPYLDLALLHNGFNRTQLATFFASYLAGRTLSTSVLSINSIDTTNGLADVVFQLAVSQGGLTSFMAYDFSFKQVSGAWLISGNGRLAEIQVRAMMNTNQGPFGMSSGPVIEADVIAPQGIVAGAVISGGTWTIATPLTWQGVSMDSGMNMEGYELMDFSGQPVPAGTPFTVVVTPPLSAPTATYTETLNTFTNEPISITSPAGTAITDANLGHPLTVSWTLPKTYAIAQVWMDLETFTGPTYDQTTKVCKKIGPTLGIASTTAQITFPTTCASLPVKIAIISLQAIGVNGENSMVYYQFGQ